MGADRRSTREVSFEIFNKHEKRWVKSNKINRYHLIGLEQTAGR